MGNRNRVRYLIQRQHLATALAVCGAALILGGCVNAPGAAAYGNYTSGLPAFNQKLAADAIQQLAALYPPARTRFNLAQPTPDPFGQALVAGLREKGYAVEEAKPAGAIQPASALEKAASGTEKGAAGLDLGYVVDQPGTGNLYRLTLAVGSQSLTRAYVAQDGSTHAAGSWTRKE